MYCVNGNLQSPPRFSTYLGRESNSRRSDPQWETITAKAIDSRERPRENKSNSLQSDFESKDSLFRLNNFSYLQSARNVFALVCNIHILIFQDCYFFNFPRLYIERILIVWMNNVINCCKLKFAYFIVLVCFPASNFYLNRRRNVSYQTVSSCQDPLVVDNRATTDVNAMVNLYSKFCNPWPTSSLTLLPSDNPVRCITRKPAGYFVSPTFKSLNFKIS